MQGQAGRHSSFVICAELAATDCVRLNRVRAPGGPVRAWLAPGLHRCLQTHRLLRHSGRVGFAILGLGQVWLSERTMQDAEGVQVVHACSDVQQAAIDGHLHIAPSLINTPYTGPQYRLPIPSLFKSSL